MKKEPQRQTARVFKRILNFRAWADYDRMKSSTLYLINGMKKMFIPKKKVQVDVFESAVTRFNLSEQDLLSKQSALYRLSLVMCGVAAFMFIYAGYHLYFLHIKAFMISFVLMLISIVFAFRYHFWYFQIKERKLGCSVNDWFRYGFLGKKR